MQIDLRDVPGILFDRGLWQQFCDRFDSKEAALAAISRPPYRRYGYHGDSADGIPAPPNERTDYVEATFRLGNQLAGWLKQSLVSGTLKSKGVVFHLVYLPETLKGPIRRGEEQPNDQHG